MMPGSRLYAFASQWFDERTVSRVFEPLLADYQREWAAAPRGRQVVITARSVAAFVRSAIALSPHALALTPMPASTTRRVLARIIVFSSVAAVVLSIPFLLQMRAMPLPQLVAAAFTLLPAGIVTAFPFAMIWVADGIRRHARPTRLERVAALRTGVIAVIFSMVAMGWVIPLSNQQYRKIAAPESARPPALGTRELTITQLMSEPSPVVADAQYSGNSNRRAVRRELNNRVVIALLPALLLWLRWTALTRPDRRWFVRLPVAAETALVVVVFFTLYLAGVWIEPTLGLDAGTGFWTPLLALWLMGTLRQFVSHRQRFASQ